MSLQLDFMVFLIHKVPPYSREKKLCLFKSHEVFRHAYFRDMIFQTIHKFLGFIFQNISYILADFNAFKHFYVSIIPFEYTVMLWYLHLYLRSMLSMFQLQFLLQRKSSMLIFETIFEKVSQFWFMLIFEACLFSKRRLLSREYSIPFYCFGMKQDLNTLKSYFLNRVNFNKSFKNIEIQVKSKKSEKSWFNSGQNKKNTKIFKGFRKK